MCGHVRAKLAGIIRDLSLRDRLQQPASIDRCNSCDMREAGQLEGWHLRAEAKSSHAYVQRQRVLQEVSDVHPDLTAVVRPTTPAPMTAIRGEPPLGLLWSPGV